MVTAMQTKISAVFISLALSASLAFAGDEERRFIREGMSEGQVLMKIGRPDSESSDSGGGAKVVVKRWIYFPTPNDPQTITTVVIRDGTVIEVSRQISR
jgi:hypothetical protein